FFFSSRRRHTRFSRDWSSDVCSSDLTANPLVRPGYAGPQAQLRGWAPATFPGHPGTEVEMPNNRIWILGAPDPEMELIEKLLVKCGESVVYATDATGQRVHPGTAYRCPVPEVPEGSTVYAVECIDVLPAGWRRIDHHRPGDPGYGRPPSDFLAASSVGQVLIELDRLGVADRLSDKDIIEAILAAAADHCLAAAYKGECPGVDPDKLMRWRVETRANFQGRPVGELLDDIERARAALREAPRIDLGAGTSVCDMRGDFVPELPEAAVRDGVAYL